MKETPRLIDFVLLIFALIFGIFLLFFYNNDKLVFKEISPCDSNVSVTIYSHKKRRSVQGYPTYRLYVRKDNRLIEEINILALFLIDWNRDIKKDKKLIWDCKNRILIINNLNSVKF